MATGDVTGDQDAATAARQLTLIATAYTRRKTGRGDVTQHSTRSTGPAHAPLPIDPGIVEHMQACVAEVITHTRAAAPTAPPAPADSAVYEWMRDHTRSLDAHRQAAAETIVYRQTLEHAIAMGDHSVVRRHPCPACHCYGLFWRPLAGKAACANRKCPDPSGDGLARTWSLAHLAHLHVQARKESSARHAT